MKYRDFWALRANQSIWFTNNISYRLGCLLAVVASRFGLQPSTVTLLGVLVSMGSVVFAGSFSSVGFWAGLALILGLQLGYALDCADGPLARATGKSSSYGALMDKAGDLIVMLLVISGLSFLYEPLVVDGVDYSVLGVMVCLVPKVFLSVTIWLKEQIISGADRLADDRRERNLWWKAKKAVALYTDEPVYRFGLAVSWASEAFWEFLFLYGAGLSGISIIYFLAAKKELDHYDNHFVCESIEESGTK